MSSFEEINKKLNNVGGNQMHLGEFLFNLAGVSKAEERVTLIKTFAAKSQGNTQAVILFANAYWRPGAEMDLPEGVPPYRAGQFKEGYEFAPSNLQKELRKLSYFIKKSPQFINNQIKREKIYIGMLECMHDNDVEIMSKIKDRKPIKNIKEEDFFKAFPTELAWLEKTNLGK